MYRIYEITGRKPVEITDTPIELKPEEVRTLESSGFRCEKIN